MAFFLLLHEKGMKAIHVLVSGIFLGVIVSCNNDDNVNEPDLQNVDIVTNIILEDVDDNGNSSDFQISFTKPTDISNIAEFRVALVKSAISITLSEIENLSTNQYFSIESSGSSSVTTQLSTTILDSDGENLVDGDNYKAYVISISNNLNENLNGLSQASNSALYLNRIIEMENIINQEMNAWNISALSVAIVKEGEVAYSKGFGIQSIGNQTPASENTLYVSSSIAKLVIAVAVMQQVEDGKLDLDEDVSTYLGYNFRNPNFPNDVITVRMLMTQRSSLALPTFGEVPDLAALYTYDSASELPFEVWIPNYLLTDGANYDTDVWRNYAPDTQHLSSNVGMGMLAYLVQLVSGEDFRDYAEAHIFLPLGMTNTKYRMDTPGSYDESSLADLFNSVGGLHDAYLYGPNYPAGLLRLSVKEWSNFMMAILNKGIYNGVRILEEATVDDMLDVKYPNANLAYGAGVALVWRELNGWIGHTGGGFITGSTDLNLSSGIGIIIISNGRLAFTVAPDANDGAIYNAVHNYALNM